MDEYRILINTIDCKGLVYRISKIIYDYGLNIEYNTEFVDAHENRFFMRSVVRGSFDQRQLFDDLNRVLPHDTYLDITQKRKKDIVIFATKESHVLGDLLLRAMDGEIDMTIQAVIANHDDLQPLVEKFGIDFHTINAHGITKEEHEKKMINILNRYSFDWIVLAKYMRILTPFFVQQYKNRVLNIHHSFLPAFIGANPYKQAFDRGVKIIGATAHYVTDDLDEGPIIAQDVVRIDHSYSWEKMRKEGKNVEKIVLANALDLLLDDRVFLHGRKTVIL